MPRPSLSDPIARLLAVHAETRRHLQAVARDDTPLTPPFADWIEGPARIAHDILEQQLFPALIESMAGSDAVCLQGMTGGLARDRADLDQRWRQIIRPALACAPTSAVPDAREALAAWAGDYLAWLERADTELLPMAARLLDDAALDGLAGDCARLDR